MSAILIKHCILILKFLKWNLPCIVSSFIFKVLKWNVCIVSGTGTLSGYDDCLACALASFTWVKATLKWLSTVAFSYCPAMQWTMISEGPEPEENQIDYSDFLPCNLMGGKVSQLPWCIGSHAYVTPTELCSLSCISQEWHFQIKSKHWTTQSL